MSATIYIWLPCVLLAWAPASGPVAEYQMQTRDSSTASSSFTFAAQLNECFPVKNKDYYVRVRGLDVNGAPGPWSADATVHRVHNFDANSNDVIDFTDFGLFIQAYLDVYFQNGAVDRLEN